MMMAVEDMATAPPTTTATAGATSKNRTAPAAMMPVVMSTCAPADAQHFPAHGHQTRQREFQSQGEDQEHHAEVRQELRGLIVRRERERMRTQEHADREIAEDGGQRQFAHGGHDAYRCGEQNQDL